ncbi:MAG: glycosyltransferase [Elusimicrobiota bacterium]
MINKADIITHYEYYAGTIDEWQGRNKYYHNTIKEVLGFAVMQNCKVLDLSCHNGALLASLKPSYGIGIDISPKMVELAGKNYPETNTKFVCADIEKDKFPFAEDEKFDYIILNNTLSETADIQKLFKRITKHCTSDTRVIVMQYNPIWQPLLKFGEKVGLKMPEMNHNWLSIDDVENFLEITGYQPVKRGYSLLFPKYIPVISEILNKFFAKIPFLRRLCIMQYCVSRMLIPPENAEDMTVSVILCVRDEEKNVEPLVQRIPVMGKHTEIVFVEGGSKDNTRTEVERIITKYPEKDIKLYIQDGKGKADACRKGYLNANGDFMILLEADLTTPPEEVQLFYDVYKAGIGEYINGSRLVYRMDKDSMPFVNHIGNRSFGIIFSLLLGQRFTDTLCGLKAISKNNYRTKITDALKVWGDFDPFGDFELIYSVIKNNMKVAEVPVHYIPRVYGAPKTQVVKHGMLLLKMVWVAFKRFVLF